jgi:hypothetical protein
VLFSALHLTLDQHDMSRIAILALFLATPWRPRRPIAAALDQAAATITESDVARRVGIIADDSMMGEIRRAVAST